MANWNDPVLSIAYATFLANLKDRDLDCAKMDFSAATNIPEGTIQYVPASKLFQRRESGAWVSIPLSLITGAEITNPTITGGTVTSKINAPAVAVGRSAIYQFSQSSGVYLPFDVDRSDLYGFHDPVTNPDRITVPSGYAGLYTVGVSLGLTASNAAEWVRLYIEKNGSFELCGQDVFDYTTGNCFVHCSGIAELSDGDYIRAWLYVGGSGTVTVSRPSGYNPSFWAVRVGSV